MPRKIGPNEIYITPLIRRALFEQDNRARLANGEEEMFTLPDQTVSNTDQTLIPDRYTPTEKPRERMRNVACATDCDSM